MIDETFQFVYTHQWHWIYDLIHYGWNELRVHDSQTQDKTCFAWQTSKRSFCLPVTLAYVISKLKSTVPHASSQQLVIAQLDQCHWCVYTNWESFIDHTLCVFDDIIMSSYWLHSVFPMSSLHFIYVRKSTIRNLIYAMREGSYCSVVWLLIAVYIWCAQNVLILYMPIVRMMLHQ